MATNVGVVQQCEKVYLSNEEATKYLGVKKEYLHELRKKGQIPYYSRGHHVWYKVNDLNRFVEKGKVI